ncbi:hypothetical protein [Natrarchaeobius chitinivorans]|uniref:Uncharacterized protein n=1 Tax=Natrarchaeobius chitinivorans TaxID=1679083 RepID=A0A3N6PFQ5_NATCH|nr:hypothetical protein [Natrarchaeobius chitinivorans]RQG96455.1 hypothetical protein EA473_04875 [Natrarchaeobius chitinivorans]
MDSSIDYEELTARVRTQSKDAAGSDTDRVVIRSLDTVDPDALSTLLETAESEEVARGDLEFVLSRANVDRLLERESEIDDRAELEDRIGRPIRAEAGMPDDTILLLSPEAVEDEEIVRPEAIACGILGADA